jgi:hypothetical protein
MLDCAQDHGQLYGGMLMLRLLTRKYEFKDESEREPLAQIVSVAFPPLLAIFQVRRASRMYPKRVCRMSLHGAWCTASLPVHTHKCDSAAGSAGGWACVSRGSPAFEAGVQSVLECFLHGNPSAAG